MEIIIKSIAIHAGLLAEGFAAIIIAIASVKTFFTFFKNHFYTDFEKLKVKDLRMQFGTSVAVALELLLGADVLMTAVTPSWNDIGMLTAIAILRTGLNYFLEKELKAGLELKG